MTLCNIGSWCNMILKLNSVVVLVSVIVCYLDVARADVEEDNVGCFSSSYVESVPYYKVKGSLSWSQGLEVCSHKLTTHMAVTPDPSSPGDYTFFCGNSLVENSESTAPSKCQRCKDRFCGGSGTVSIYKLRDATPFSVLLILSGSAIFKLTEEDDLPVLETVVSLDTKMWDMNYHFAEDEVWHTHQNNTYRTTYDAIKSEYNRPKKIPSCDSINQSPTPDWVKGVVYYGCAAERKIYELDFDGNVLKTYDTKLPSNIRMMVFDPWRRMMFIATSATRVFSYSLDSGLLTEFTDFGGIPLKGNHLCIDQHEQRLYIVGKVGNETDNTFLKVDYKNTKADVIYKGPELSNVWNCDVFNNTVIWSNARNDSLDIAFNCKLNPKCEKENMRVIYSDDRQSITDLKIYHPLKQMPGPGDLCDSLQCSHTCKELSQFEARCQCPTPLRLNKDKKTCSDTPAETSLDQIHLGCFSSQFAKSHPYYMIKLSLSFDQGAKLCGHRLTTHMAVTPDPSYPEEYIVFCGNDLLEHSESVEQSRCQRCSDDVDKYCGGLGTVSLYQLRESTPLSVVVANSGTAIVRFTEENGGWTKTSLFPLSTRMYDMDYYYEEDEIWFSYKNTTYRSVFNPVASKYITPRTVTLSCDSDNQSPVFDWVKHRVYYACADEKNIYELDLNGNYMKIYEPKIYRYIKSIAVDPYKRLAFIDMSGHKMFSYSLDTGKLKEFIRYGRYFLKSKTMCLDHHGQNLYVVGELEGAPEKAIVKVNYQNTKASIVYQGPELSEVWAMDFFNGTMVWTNFRKSDNLDIAYICRLTPKCLPENIKEITKDPIRSITNIKIYHPLKQTPNNQALCEEFKCSRYCTRTSLFEAKC